MKYKNNLKYFFCFIAILLFVSSCSIIKPYQMNYLNQEDMKLSQYKLETYDNSVESYREGASGANGGKTGGGCGCN